MRIIKWHNDIGIGGTQATLERQAIELGKRGHEVIVSCFSDGVMDRAQNLVNQCNVFVKPINRDNKQKEFQELVDFCKPDIIHSFRSGYPEFPQPGVDFSLGNTKFVETNVFGNFDPSPLISKTLYMSEYLWKEVAKTSGSRFDFVNNATPEPSISKPLSNPLRKMCGPNTIVLGRIGRDNDGIYDPIAMNAINLLLERRPELRRDILFYVMSPPPSMEKDLRKYKINYLVHETVTQPELISRFLFNCDIYCAFRRDGETFGCNLSEASMHSLPIITHVAKPKDPNMFPFQNQCKLVNNGVTGFAVDHDPLLYANALEKLIDNPELREEMGEAGHEKALKEFSTKVCVDKIEKIYGELING